MQSDFFQQIKGMEVLVVGDVMLDRYLRGEVSRISPEAPVPILDLQQAENRLGGAGNVVLNLRALGAKPFLCSITGEDEEGRLIAGLLDQEALPTDGLVCSSTRHTTVKIRLLADGQHLLRVDKEDRHLLHAEEEKSAFDRIHSYMKQRPVRAILFQDYDKGYLTPTLISAVLELADQNGIPTIVDPKFRHFYTYKGVSLFKPNLKEVRARVPFEVKPTLNSLRDAASYLRERLEFEYILITLSEHGAFIDGRGDSLIAPTQAQDIVDVCGAGDAVASVVALGLVAGLSAPELVHLANAAGGQVCAQVGVVAVEANELQQYWNRYNSSKL